MRVLEHALKNKNIHTIYSNNSCRTQCGAQEQGM